MKADELLISAEELPWREFDFLADHGSMSDLAISRKSRNVLAGSQAHSAFCGTHDLCRDSTEAGSNLLKLRVTDGFFWRYEIPMVTVIGPLSDPRPLP